MTDELDEILKTVIDTFSNTSAGYKVMGTEEEVVNAKQAIQALIDRECTKAKINELERTAKYAGAWFSGNERLVNWVNMEIIRDRIAELSNKENNNE